MRLPVVDETGKAVTIAGKTAFVETQDVRQTIVHVNLALHITADNADQLSTILDSITSAAQRAQAGLVEP